MTASAAGETARIRLRTESLAKYRKMLGLTTDDALAKRIGVDPATVHRILRKPTHFAPGPKFIAGLLTAFAEYDVDFNDLFEVVGGVEDVAS